jgi:uncharacterized protein
MAAKEKSVQTVRETRPGKFVWFEHASDDPKKAQEFYREVIGWKVEPYQGGYDMILAGQGLDSMIGGYTKATGRPHWISYVSVEDVDAAAKTAAANGGNVLEPPFEIPEIGRAARIADPQGAELYLFKNSSGDPDDPSANAAPPARRFFWNELHTTDPKRALSFYEKVIGFTHETKNMGPGEDYHILSRNGVGRGGVSGHLAGTSPHWLPYVSVDDPDTTLERVKKHGGKVHVKAADIPGIGRFGVLEDSSGAFLAIMKAIPPQP